MAAAYAIKYPHRVSRLILLSPVGVPHQTIDYQRRVSAMPTAQRALFGLVNTLWQRGVTPNQFIRVSHTAQHRTTHSQLPPCCLPLFPSSLCAVYELLGCWSVRSRLD